MSTKTKRITESAMLLAIAIVLEFAAKLFIPELPFGGQITLVSMLPVVLISYRHGIKWGFFVSFTYSIIQIIMDLYLGKGGSTIMALFMPDSDDYMGIVAAIAILVIDYIIAYTVLCLGGVFRNRIKSKTLAIVLGVVLALGARYICHIVSGYIFYGAWAEWFFTQEGFYAIGAKILGVFSGKGLALIYSIFYNGLYMIPEIVITALAAVPVSRISNINKIDLK